MWFWARDSISREAPYAGATSSIFRKTPISSGKMAAGYVRGIESKGRYALPQALRGEQPGTTEEWPWNAVVDERTLREIYLTGFEIAIKEGKAHALMTSYNQVNGDIFQ